MTIGLILFITDLGVFIGYWLFTFVYLANGVWVHRDVKMHISCNVILQCYYGPCFYCSQRRSDCWLGIGKYAIDRSTVVSALLN